MRSQLLFRTFLAASTSILTACAFMGCGTLLGLDSASVEMLSPPDATQLSDQSSPTDTSGDRAEIEAEIGTEADATGEGEAGGDGDGAADGEADAGTVEHVAFKELSEHDAGLTLEHARGETRILRDRSAGASGDLFGFGWSDKLYMFASRDVGDSWRFVGPAQGKSIANHRLLGIAQDSQGKVHLLNINSGSGNVEYSRLALTHTSGHISSFSAEITELVAFGPVNSNLEAHGAIQTVLDAAGNETLVYQVTDGPELEGGGGGFRVLMGQVKSLTPGSTGDFLGLDGNASPTVVISDSKHSHTDRVVLFAQLETSRKLWVFVGRSPDNFGQADGCRLTRTPITATGAQRWSVGATVEGAQGNLSNSPELLSVYPTKNFVWVLYSDTSDGLSIDRVSKNGDYAHGVVASPEDTSLGFRTGWGALSVAQDETRLWAIWNTQSGDGSESQNRTTQAAWDGNGWTTFVDTPIGLCRGIGGTSGWAEGMSAVLVAWNYQLWVSTVRTGRPQ